MNKRKLFVFATLALVLLFSVLAVEAGAEKMPPGWSVTFTYRWVQNLQPGDFWVDEEGTHVRERVDLIKLEGSVSGTAVVVYNADTDGFFDPAQVDPALPIMPGDGQAYGTISLFTNLLDMPAPNWSGNWDHKIEDGRVTAGGMTAFSRDRRWVMRISSITESDKRVLVYRGTVAYNCDLLPCSAGLD